MKKLAELQIGNQMIVSNMYERYGSPTLFMVFKDDKLAKKSFRRGFYEARCIQCGAAFTIRPYSVWRSQEVTCPACGRVHKGNAVMYADSHESLLPDVTVMKVIDFKDTVELRIKYSAAYFGKFLYKTYKYYYKQEAINETYVFDVKNSRCLWRKEQDGRLLDKAEIGYLTDFLKLKEQTALWYYSIDHKINKGNSFAELLKALRTAVNKKIKANGKTPKPLYIGGNFKSRLYGNVLNLAHRVRFWDSVNVPALAGGEYAVSEFNNKILGTQYLPKRFEEQIYLAMQKTDFVSAICKVLKIPNIPHTRRNLQFENLAMLHECYKIKNYDVAQAMFAYAKPKGLYGINQVRDMTAFYNKFIGIYPKMQMQHVIKKWEDEYSDILRLWKAADKITKQEFNKKTPALSELHDWLSIAVAKQNDREIIFDVPDEVINRYTMLMKAFGVKCIEKNSELKFWATSLRNCAAGYKHSICDRKQLVGISDDRGKPVALLEINGNRLTQAKLFANDPVYYKKDVNKVVWEFAERCNLKIDTKDVVKPSEQAQALQATVA